MRGTLPFTPSERLVYEAEFSRSLLRGINIARFTFTATERRAPVAPNSPANATPPTELLLTSEAVSKGFFQKLFGLNFRFAIESVIEPVSFNVISSRKHDQQGKRIRTSDTVHDLAARRLVWTERDPNAPANTPRVVEATLTEAPGALQDIASVFYYLRTQPLTPGSRLELTMTDSGRLYRVPFEVVGTKRLNTALGKQNTVEVNVNLFGTDRLIEGRGEMTLWFTNDVRHIPLRARIKNEYGTLTVKLVKKSPES